MAQVISATAQFRGSRAAVGAFKRERFMEQASDLLAQARAMAAAGRWDQALEFAYQAGLRTAGARIADSAVAKRRRLPSSAWAQLALVGGEEKEWAERFGAYSRLRSRVASGLEDAPSDEVVLEVMALAAEFLSYVEEEMGFGSLAA
ncbi:SAV_6107 family HEPN domain-containing protein [Corynebacterium striatum]|uniref:SAV_6107 family HEPN domain-containing protein n=1 Tax=Corynebacterium striatum TaxID=43770 RepID=UPI0027BA95AC|nr:SAV_6107 family HEPN domain-containing protein [Corynebacterium striatum]